MTGAKGTVQAQHRSKARVLADMPRLHKLSLLLLTCLALTALAAPPALASHNELVYFEAPGQLLSPKLRPGALRELKALGVKALRVELHWHEVAPSPNARHKPHFDATDPHKYHWGQYDVLLGEAQALGWPVLLTVTSPVPRWATSNHRKPYVTRPDDLDFQQFMTAVARHFGPAVSMYAIWNEPNIPGWLRPQFKRNGRPASPRIYRGLYQAGYAGLRAAGLTHPKVLMGELAPFGQQRVRARREGVEKEMAPLTFLRESLCLNSHYHKWLSCGAVHATGYAIHPYTYPARQGVSYVPRNRDQVPIGALWRLSHALDRAAHAHAINPHLPLYLNEYGVESKPNPLGVSGAAQAEYDALSEKIAWNNYRVAAFSQYLLRDEHSHGRLKGYRTGLEDFHGRHKLLYYAYPLPLVVLRTHSGYSLWGLVRPAEGATKVRVMIKRRHSRGFHTLKVVSTNSDGEWTLHSSSAGVRWRVSWRSPKGKIYNGPPIRAH
jgi:hypothetical protein